MVTNAPLSKAPLLSFVRPRLTPLWQSLSPLTPSPRFPAPTPLTIPPHLHCYLSFLLLVPNLTMENNHPYQITLLYHGRLRPLGNLLLQWIHACPNNFWYHIEEEMAHTLKTQAHTLPPDTTDKRVIIPISRNLAFVSPAIPLLQNNLTHWMTPQRTFGLSGAEAPGSPPTFFSLASTTILLTCMGE